MKNQTKTIIAWLIFFGYSSCLIYWMFRGFDRVPHSDYRYNYIPLRTIFGYLLHINPNNFITSLINLAGNIGVFIPFGILLPYIIKKLRSFTWFSAYFIGAVMVLEIMQTILRVGTGDVDDVILNYIGGCLGFLLYRVGLSPNNIDKDTITRCQS